MSGGEGRVICAACVQKRTTSAPNFPASAQRFALILPPNAAIKPPAGFPDHPHRGFETVSYLLQGTVRHEDFAGHKGTMHAGCLQWMTAGRGIMHSEAPVGTEEGIGVQLWVNLAAKEKMVEPAYQELARKDVPKVSKDGVTVAVIAGESLGVKSPVRTRTPTMYLDIALEAGKELQQPIPAGWNALAYVFTGPVSFGASSDAADAAAATVKSQHTVLFTNSSDADGVTIRAPADAPARLLLLAGKPIGEPIVQHGPFVMNTREEIMRAMHDFSTGTNGFERALTWTSEASRKH
jgi:quercetin 2,3-dioxygenase